MKREVVWVAAAEVDAPNLFGWLHERSPKAAQRLLGSLCEQAELIAEFPELAGTAAARFTARQRHFLEIG